MPPDDAPHIDPRPTAYPDPQTAGTPPQPIPQPMPPPVVVATLLALSVPVVLAVLSLFFALWHRL